MATIHSKISNSNQQMLLKQIPEQHLLASLEEVFFIDNKDDEDLRHLTKSPRSCYLCHIKTMSFAHHPALVNGLAKGVYKGFLFNADATTPGSVRHWSEQLRSM